MGNKLVQSHIFTLIWSLSNSEKKYLRKHYLSGNESADFVQLFNIIDSSKLRSIEKIQRKIESIPNLSRKKNYLLEAINNTLYHLNANRTMAMQISKDIVIIDALISKNLLDQALKIIKQNKKRASEIEDYTNLVRLLSYEKIIIKHNENKNRDKVLNEIGKQESIALDNLRIEKKYSALKGEVWETIKNEGNLPYLHLLEQIEEQLSTPYFHDENFAHTFNSKSHFNSAKFLFQDVKGNKEMATFYMKKQVQLFDDNPLMKEERKYDYLTVLNNYAMSIGKNGNLKKALDIFSQMEQLECSTEYLKLKKFEYLASNKLGLIVDNQISHNYMGFISYCEEGLEKYGKKLNKLFQVICVYNLGNHYIYLGDFKKALEFNYKVLNEKFSFRKDVQKFARLIQVVIHIELKNYMNLEYYLQSIKRYFSKQSNLYAFESWFLEFLDKYVALLVIDENAAQKFLISKSLEVESMKSTESWVKVTGYFDFTGWFHYKIDSKPMMKTQKL